MGRLVAIVIALGGCGGGDAKIDAAIPDVAIDQAPFCANTTCNATCCATPAQVCMTTCACPSGIITTPLAPSVTQMDTTRRAPAVLGIGVVQGADSKNHAIVIGFDPTATPLNTDIALPSSPFGGAPFVALGYRANPVSGVTISNYFASQGTLNLTRRCAAGVAGHVAGVMMKEQTSADDATPVAGGCTLAVPDFDFDFGNACP